MSDPQRYPLAWPHGWPRTFVRQSSNFSSKGGYYQGSLRSYQTKLTLSDAFDRIERELDRLGVRQDSIILSSNLMLGARGSPLANQAEPADPGIAVYFKLKGKDRVLACDKYKRAAENIAAIAAHIDALRRIDRYGVGTLDQAFAGYTALPSPDADNRAPWRKVLGLSDAEHITRDTIVARYREKARDLHPDNGGTHEGMAQLNLARDEALREIA